MLTQPLAQAVLDAFRTQMAGDVILPADPQYDGARVVFNTAIDKRPALIARCTSVSDVVAAVRLVRDTGVEVAVRSGGHSLAGASVSEGGVVIDLRPMKEITIDPALGVARLGAGCTWGEFDAAAQEFGLATTGGRVSTTGVSGLTLGGGLGWLERRWGLACDSLVSAELVTSDGSVVTADEGTHPDLFWALHGGGGNFGIATALSFRLHPVGPTVLAGLLLWPGAAGPDLLRLYRDFADIAPDELGSAAAFITAPATEFVPEPLRGEICCVVALCYSGALEDGEAAIAPLRAFGPPAADLVQPMPYAAFQGMFDSSTPPGLRNWWTDDYLDEVSDEAIDTFVRHGSRTTSPLSQSYLIPRGGAVARVSEGETPLAQRRSAWVAHLLATWGQPGEDDEHVGWGRAFAADIRRFTSGGVYLNLTGDESEERILAAFGQDYARLAEIKARYDPDNLFRLGHNIKPASPANGAGRHGAGGPTGGRR